MQDMVGALSAALLGDGDGAAEAPEHHPEDEHQDGVEGDQEVPLPQPASHIDFVATWESAMRSGAELIKQRCSAFKLWRDICRPYRKSKLTKTLRPAKLSLVQHNGVVHLWHWKRNADVIWHTDSNVISGRGTPVRLDLQQRAIYPIHLHDPMITIAESDSSCVVWPDVGIEILKYGAPLRDHIPDWILRVKRMWNLCMHQVPLEATCAICGKPNSNEMLLSTCCMCDITTHTSCIDSIMNDSLRSAIESSRAELRALRSHEYQDFKRCMPDIMCDESGTCKCFCTLCSAVVFVEFA